jgi:hypothetical protein
MARLLGTDVAMWGTYEAGLARIPADQALKLSPYGIPLDWIYQGRMADLHPHIRAKSGSSPLNTRGQKRGPTHALRDLGKQGGLAKPHWVFAEVRCHLCEGGQQARSSTGRPTFGSSDETGEDGFGGRGRASED